MRILVIKYSIVNGKPCEWTGLTALSNKVNGIENNESELELNSLAEIVPRA